MVLFTSVELQKREVKFARNENLREKTSTKWETVFPREQQESFPSASKTFQSLFQRVVCRRFSLVYSFSYNYRWRSYLPQTSYGRIIVNRDMVWKLGKLQSAYNELQFNVETASPCTNLLKFCWLIFQQHGWEIQQCDTIGRLLHYTKNSLSSPCTGQHKHEQKDKTKTLVKFPDHIFIDFGRIQHKTTGTSAVIVTNRLKWNKVRQTLKSVKPEQFLWNIKTLTVIQKVNERFRKVFSNFFMVNSYSRAFWIKIYNVN